MRTFHRNSVFLAPVVLSLLLGGCSDEPETTTATDQGSTEVAAAPATQPAAPQPADVVARVGDEVITFSLLNTMLNSSAVVGLSVPALGTPERKQVIITLLDKAISANLLYLDARQQGVDQQPEYLRDIRRFDDAVLAQLYRDKYLLGNITVSEEEIADYHKTALEPGTELDDDTRMAITATLRKQKLEQLKNTQRERIREGMVVEVDAGALNPEQDETRKDTDAVAEFGGEKITWGEVKGLMQGADQRVEHATFYLDSDTERLKRLDGIIDARIMAEKGRAAGLEQDPGYIARTAEFHKTRLINLHRTQLIESWQPSEETLQAYFMEHQDKISIPEMRKLQMVVLETKEEADALKQQIEAGELTMFQAAQEHSIDPNAKQTLGEMGWVARGSGFKELDDFTFFQEPDVLGGPIQSPAGWHLVKVLDVQDAQYQSLEEPEARRKTLRMYMREKLDSYVIDLRKNSFSVKVDEPALAAQFQKEADFMAELNRKAAEEGSITKQREQELQKLMQE